MIHAEFIYMRGKRQVVKYLDVAMHKHAEYKIPYIYAIRSVNYPTRHSQ